MSAFCNAWGANFSSIHFTILLIVRNPGYFLFLFIYSFFFPFRIKMGCGGVNVLLSRSYKLVILRSKQSCFPMCASSICFKLKINISIEGEIWWTGGLSKCQVVNLYMQMLHKTLRRVVCVFVIFGLWAINQMPMAAVVARTGVIWVFALLSKLLYLCLRIDLNSWLGCLLAYI